MSDSTNPKITITEEGQKSLRDFERKSGIEIYGLGYDRVKWKNTLQKFAKMVAEQEREECAKLCENMNSIEEHYGNRIELVCADAIRAREQE